MSWVHILRTYLTQMFNDIHPFISSGVFPSSIASVYLFSFLCFCQLFFPFFYFWLALTFWHLLWRSRITLIFILKCFKLFSIMRWYLAIGLNLFSANILISVIFPNHFTNFPTVIYFSNLILSTIYKESKHGLSLKYLIIGITTNWGVFNLKVI